jgi:cardiolipin synthase
MVALIVVVFHILGLLSSIHAIMSTRTAQGAIAWDVSL